MKNLTIILCIFFAITLFSPFMAQDKKKANAKPINQINSQAQSAKKEKTIAKNNDIKKDTVIANKTPELSLPNLEVRIREIEEKNLALKKSEESLIFKIKELNNTLETQKSSIVELQNSAAKINNLEGKFLKKTQIGIISLLFLFLTSVFIFWYFNKIQSANKLEAKSQINQLKEKSAEDAVKVFNKLLESQEEQLQLLSKQKTESSAPVSSEPDHSFVLKVANEVNLIERNLKLMDPKTKGIKQLDASVGRVKDNLISNGYEMPELLGKPFHQGMKVIIASSIPCETIEKGSEIITKVILPQVNYKDEKIQTAQIEVSIGC